MKYAVSSMRRVCGSSESKSESESKYLGHQPTIFDDEHIVASSSTMAHRGGPALSRVLFSFPFEGYIANGRYTVYDMSLRTVYTVHEKLDTLCV